MGPEISIVGTFFGSNRDNRLTLSLCLRSIGSVLSSLGSSVLSSAFLPPNRSTNISLYVRAPCNRRGLITSVNLVVTSFMTLVSSFTVSGGLFGNWPLLTSYPCSAACALYSSAFANTLPPRLFHASTKRDESPVTERTPRFSFLRKRAITPKELLLSSGWFTMSSRDICPLSPILSVCFLCSFDTGNTTISPVPWWMCFWTESSWLCI